MALFSRRALQRMLDENACWMLPRQVRRHVSTLNNPAADNRIPIEWEIAVLNALCKLGQVVHEPKLTTGRAPDVLFLAGNGPSQVIADITTVSDKGLHAQNPFGPLLDELQPFLWDLRNRGVSGGFRVKAGDNSNPKRIRRERVSLKLPPPRRFKDQILTSKFQAFISDIAASPGMWRQFVIKTEDTDLEILYQPGSRFLCSSYAPYTLCYSETENRAFASMAEKADQLKGAPYDAALGIFLCDGDCVLFGRGSGKWAGGPCGISDVVDHFFHDYPFISFVVVLTIKQSPRFANSLNVGPGTLCYDCCLYSNPGLPPLHSSVADAFSHLPSSLPQPMRTAQNARYHLEWLRRTGRWHKGETHFGGLTVSSRQIKISLRTVQELLAGDLTKEDFLAEYSHDGGTAFRDMLQQGRLMTNVRVEKSHVPEDDDDWLVFEFGEPDAAVMQFVTRSGNKRQKASRRSE